MDVDRQVEIFNEIILNIMGNFIPNKVLTVDDRELKWMNGDSKIKMNGDSKIKIQVVCNQ